MPDYLPFLFVLAVLAILLHDDTVITLFYLLAGVYFVRLEAFGRRLTQRIVWMR